MKNIIYLLSALLLAACPHAAFAQNSWYLHANQPGADSWSTASDWYPVPFGGTAGTTINSTDNYFSNGYSVRTGGTGVFGGASLSMTGGTIIVKTATASINNLIASGAAITNGNGATQVVTITNLIDTDSMSINSGGTTRGLTASVGTLTGNGHLTVAGGGTVSLAVTQATGFYGTIYLTDATTVTFPSAITSSGDLNIDTTSKVVLNGALTVTGLTVSGAVQVPGTYPYATLHTAWPAIFTSGTGSITVLPVNAWYLHANQPLSDSWNTATDWFSALTGGTAATAINPTDIYSTNGFQLRTPGGGVANPFGGADLLLHGGSILLKNLSTAPATSIGNLDATSGSISNGTSGNIVTNLTDFSLTGTVTLDSAASNRGFNLTVNKISGPGTLSFSGHSGGTLLLNIGDAANYTGTINLSASSPGTVTIQNPIFSAGGFTVGAGNTVNLNNQNIYVTKLTIGTTVEPSNATYSAAFLGFTGGGTVTVLNRPQRMFGVNLSAGEGGTVPGVIDHDYTYPTQAELTYYHSKGQNLLRIPFKWERLQKTLNGPLTTADLARLDSVVGWARTLGMKIILDMHNYDKYGANLVGSTAVPVTAFQDVWTKIATHYATETAILGYDLMNEPVGTGNTWWSTAQSAVNAIRLVDTTHYIIVEGDSWATAANWPAANPNLDIVDPSGLIMYQAHCYIDSDASGQYTASYDVNHVTPTIGVERMAPFLAWLKAKHAWGMIGEFGVPKNDARYNVALENMLQYMQNNGLSGTYWHGGVWSGGDPLSCEPGSNYTVDAPQMAILQQFTQ